MFAAGGCDVTLVARDLAKAESARTAIQGIAKSERIADIVHCSTYDAGLAEIVADADIIFEALAEDMALKRDLFAKLDAVRPPDAVVATVSSGLSIHGMTEGLSQGFREHFAGIHLYNPPHVMTGVEVIPHSLMNADLVDQLREVLGTRFGRQVVTCADTPAFAGNRIGFKILNECARLAETHGVQLVDTLVGPYTGRAMAPLATIDLVGWDVHQAIVDNVAANVRDEAGDAFTLPPYMAKLIAAGHLGDKTPATGGFYRKSGQGAEVLDPARGTYTPAGEAPSIPFVEAVRDLNRRGKYREAMAAFIDATGPEAEMAQRVILGYVSYALNRCGPGEVVADYQSVDRIMSSGFNWAPPSALVDLIGQRRTAEALDRLELPRPKLIDGALAGDVPTPLFDLPSVTPGRYLAGQ
jgi:3-hydroxyacyl-CoA dehydrogenase